MSSNPNRAVNRAKKGVIHYNRRRRTKGPSEKIRRLAALSLASKIGYLTLQDLDSPSTEQLTKRSHLRGREHKTHSTNSQRKATSRQSPSGSRQAVSGSQQATSGTGASSGGGDEGGGDGDGDAAGLYVILIFPRVLGSKEKLDNTPGCPKSFFSEEAIKFLFQLLLEVFKVATALILAWFLLKWGLK